MQRIKIAQITENQEISCLCLKNKRCAALLRGRKRFFGASGWLDAADRFQPGAGVDFRLRQHGGLGAETLDQRTYEGPDRGRSDQHRRFALACGLFEPLAHDGHELRQPRRLHGEAAFLALADQRFRKRLLPLRRQRDQRQIAVDRGVLRADLARQARADMFDHRRRVAREGERVGDAFENGGEIADRDAFGQQTAAARAGCRRS